MPKIVEDTLIVFAFEDFVDHVYHGLKPADERIGQWAFELLARLRPQIAKEVHGGIFDPYHKNFISPEFLDFVKKRW